MPATTYTSPGKALHWGMAFLIVGLLCVGTAMVFLPRGALRSDVYDIHKQLGVTVLGLAALRLGWRATAIVPLLPVAMGRGERLLAHVGHLGLYVLMFGMPMSGILFSQAADRPIHLVGMTLPALVGKDDGLREFAKTSHEVMAWLIGLMVVGHAVAVLRHHFMLKDDVLRRMLPFRKS